MRITPPRPSAAHNVPSRSASRHSGRCKSCPMVRISARSTCQPLRGLFAATILNLLGAFPRNYSCTANTTRARGNTVQISARQDLRGGPGGEDPRRVAPEQRLRGISADGTPEALLRGKTAMGPPRHGSSPSHLHGFALFEPYCAPCASLHTIIPNWETERTRTGTPLTDWLP